MKNQLRYIRETVMGMSRKQLSIYAKVSMNTISAIEDNNRKVFVDTAIKLSRALHVKVEDVFVLDDTD